MNFKQKTTPLYIVGALGVVASVAAGTVTYITHKNKKATYEAKHKAEQAKRAASHRRTRG